MEYPDFYNNTWYFFRKVCCRRFWFGDPEVHLRWPFHSTIEKLKDCLQERGTSLFNFLRQC